MNTRRPRPRFESQPGQYGSCSLGQMICLLSSAVLCQKKGIMISAWQGGWEGCLWQWMLRKNASYTFSHPFPLSDRYGQVPGRVGRYLKGWIRKKGIPDDTQTHTLKMSILSSLSGPSFSHALFSCLLLRKVYSDCFGLHPSCPTILCMLLQPQSLTLHDKPSGFVC